MNFYNDITVNALYVRTMTGIYPTRKKITKSGKTILFFHDLI